MKVVVVGAGFTGLTSAYYLNQAGVQVEVHERSSVPGGLIHTVQTPWGLVETAANGVLNTKKFEDLARDIGLPLQATRLESRKRYIFREKPRRWPLRPLETLEMGTRFALNKNKKPLKGETIEHWGHRILGNKATRFVLAPALQGIYAGKIAEMSASLVLGRFFNKKSKPPKPILRGTVAPAGGMGRLMSRLDEVLKERGVEFRYGSEVKLGGPGCHVICGSAHQAGNLLNEVDPTLSRALRSIEMMGLVKATVFFPPSTEPSVRGFGCLFPRDQGFRSLGVLLNHDIFAGMTDVQSETWILGGAGDREAASLGDRELLTIVDGESRRFHGREAGIQPLGFHAQRWNEALPHYTTELENILATQQDSLMALEKNGIILMGNYLGSLGLSQILEQTSQLPARVPRG